MDDLVDVEAKAIMADDLVLTFQCLIETVSNAPEYKYTEPVAC
jgi:hypothetical protein